MIEAVEQRIRLVSCRSQFTVNIVIVLLKEVSKKFYTD